MTAIIPIRRLASLQTGGSIRGVADDPKTMLVEILRERPDLASAAAAIFDYAQYLLDDDERLTKSGALDGEARELLRARALETLGGPTGPEPETEDEHEEDEDDEYADEPDQDEDEDDE